MAIIRKGDPRNLSKEERARRKIVRDERLASLAAARQRSSVEIRDGREFRVLRLSDRYAERLGPGATPLLPHEIDRLSEAE